MVCSRLRRQAPVPVPQGCSAWSLCLRSIRLCVARCQHGSREKHANVTLSQSLSRRNRWRSSIPARLDPSVPPHCAPVRPWAPPTAVLLQATALSDLVAGGQQATVTRRWAHPVHAVLRTQDDLRQLRTNSRRTWAWDCQVRWTWKPPGSKWVLRMVVPAHAHTFQPTHQPTHQPTSITANTLLSPQP